MRAESGATVTLSEGAKGSFEIFVDGRQVYSKLETGLVPKAEKILAVLNGA